MERMADKHLVGSSPKIGKVRSIAIKAAAVDSIVLILGESGTGKEVTARYIHDLSERRHEPFIAVNCGAIPPELMASEFFGHERGAFTGAINRTKGCFERAGHGTLFLDEIGEMSMEMQVKLLRVLQERQVERLGTQGQAIQIHARIIAATNQNLWQMVENKQFRSDLYYRLNVLPIHMPSLRDCPQNINELIDHACHLFSQRGMTPPVISKDACAILCNYEWPGNVRQLFNIIERLCVLHPGETIYPNNLPQQINSRRTEHEEIESERGIFSANEPKLFHGFDMKAYLKGVETNLIRTALDEADGVIARAARLLGINRTTLTEKIRRLSGLEQEMQRPTINNNAADSTDSTEIHAISSNSKY